jgi:hypothetical protein
MININLFCGCATLQRDKNIMIHSLKPNANTISQFELSGKEIN